MSQSNSNPYEAQIPFGHEETATQGLKLNEPLPKGLMIFSILFVIFGILGIFAFPMAGVGMMVNQFMPQPQGDAPEVVFSRKMQAVSAQLMVPALAVALVDSVLSCVMTYGGIQVLRRRANGLRVLSNVCLWAMGFEIIRTLFGAYASYLNQEAFQSFPMNAQMKNSPIGPFLELFFGNILLITVIYSVFLVLFRFGYYGWAYSIFKRVSNLEFMQPASQR